MSTLIPPTKGETFLRKLCSSGSGTLYVVLSLSLVSALVVSISVLVWRSTGTERHRAPTKISATETVFAEIMGSDERIQMSPKAIAGLNRIFETKPFNVGRMTVDDPYVAFLSDSRRMYWNGNVLSVYISKYDVMKWSAAENACLQAMASLSTRHRTSDEQLANILEVLESYGAEAQ